VNDARVEAPAPDATAGAPRRRRNPWWIPPFFGSVPADVGPGHLRVLGLVSLALLFEEYDISLLNGALPFISADLGMAEQHFGLYLGIIRLGALPALYLVSFADRVGRRRVFLVSVLGSAGMTFLTAFAQEPAHFVACQMLMRIFLVAGSAVAIVILIEELPSENRGWGIGMLAALGGVGHGLGAALFAGIEVWPFGWRALYFAGLAAVLVMPALRRNLGETQRFLVHRTARAPGLERDGALAPFVRLVQAHPWRALGISVVALVASVGQIAAFQFTGYFTQTFHGWEPWEFSVMVIGGGFLGMFGNVLGGRLGDRIGRRPLAFVFLLLFPLAVALFYRGPNALTVWVAWIALVFASSASRVVLRALSTELFPTSARGTASGLYTALDVLGSAVGLLLHSALMDAGLELRDGTVLLGLVVVVPAGIVLAFPETRARELEALSHEVTQ
jgi:MFS family permease